MTLIDRKKRNLFLVRASFFAPGTLILIGLSIFPFLYAVILSLFNWNLARPQWGVHFVSIKNYIDLLLTSRFRVSIVTTFIILGGSVCLQLVLGIFIALLLTNSQVKGIRIIRAIIILPSVVTPVVVGLLWLLLYKHEFGLINFLLTKIGLRQINWLTTVWGARFALIIADTWQWTPFVSLVVLAGIMSIPQSIIEASKVDGTNPIQYFFHIMLPMIKPSILVVLLIRTIDGFRVFDKIFAITKGGPGGATETLSYYIYVRGFNNFEMGVAAAASVFLLVLVTIVVQMILKVFGADKLFVSR